MPAAQRDTDADWRELGETQPYWGVLTQPEYRAENLTPETLDAFYASGVSDISGVVERLQHATGVRPKGRALDFGCGAGRLTEAMAIHVDEAVGYDISPGMLARARERGGKGRYVDALPSGPFDWINSFIVFQHIPPERGMGLLQDLLDRLAPGGLVSLHLTVWRDAEQKPPTPQGWRKLLAPWLEARYAKRLTAGAIMMYDYDLGAVVEALNRGGVQQMTLISTDHGGHHGVIILGRREVAP